MTLRQAALTTRAMVVAVTVSMVALLDSTVINLALPTTERELGGGMALQQRVVGGYLLAMAVAIVPAGSISDRFGRVPVMRFGLLTFGAGSTLAAVATSPGILITARLIQGLGAAFLVPSSLALINTVFDEADRPAAIGVWTGWTGTAFALGPVLGGVCVDFFGWRWIFVLSAIPMVLRYALTFWLCPMSTQVDGARVDVGGEHRSTRPLRPLRLYNFRNFVAANAVTALVYGGLTMGSLAIALYTQEIAGYSATAVGLSTLPIPAMSLLFARHVGRIATTVGLRVLLIAGPLVAAAGLLLIRPEATGFHAITHLVPGVTVLSIGLVATITPLTSAMLASLPIEHGGLASAINNAVARLASLISIATMGLISGGAAGVTGFARALEVSALLFGAAAVCAALLFTNLAVPNPMPCEIAALCGDRPRVQPATVRRPGRPPTSISHPGE